MVCRLSLSLFLLFRSPPLVSGFTKIPAIPRLYLSHEHKQQLPVASDDSDTLLSSSMMDFSSTLAWERFYQERDNDVVTEWHSSITFDDIIRYCRPNNKKEAKQGAWSILCIGCGDSRLPDAFLNNSSPDISYELTIMDSSPTCIAKMKQRYAEEENVSCVCGSVMELQTILTTASFDVIVDKGLIDALLCGEGWDVPVQKLMDQSQSVLAANGTYVLVSYTLPPSTQEFLRQGTTWEWKFGQIATSRSMISTAAPDV